MDQTLTRPHHAIAAKIDDLKPTLEALSLRVHAHPELAWEERQAAAWLTGALEDEGFAVERELSGLETAFRATYELGAGGPTVALLAEYDALPDLGHACGHNLICTAAIGAALALRHVLEGQGLEGRIQVIGTPAEEGGGGKIVLLERGAFEGIDAAMMFHPGARTMTTRGSLAATRVTMAFHGKAAHAAAAPHLGVNALDACIQTFNAINALRQHVKDETRIHGIITKGGSAPNIVPDYAEAKFSVRHRNLDYLQEVKEKVLDCARGAAMAVGATVEFSEGLTYAERKVNRAMAGRFGEHLEALGEPVKEPPQIGGVGSSDFGNLSQVLPAIHPYVAIVPEGVSGHTPEFAAASASPEGIRGMLLAAKALALTTADLLADPRFLAKAKEEFVQEANP
jgi:amidohydrolase